MKDLSMSRKKIWITGAGGFAVLLIVLVITFSLRASTIKVNTAKATRQDLVSTVSGSGQIKPKTYVNIGATAFGRITHLYVKEGDQVKQGQLVATVESEQPASAVAAQQATIAASKTDVQADIAAEHTAQAAVDMAHADLEQKNLDFTRAQALYDAKLIAKQDYDAKKAAYDVSAATLAQREASYAQSTSQTASQRGHVNQAIATLRGNDYSLGLTQSRAPFDGLVTNVPVREGETVVLGIQNAEGSTLMTLADMSVITAEVKVDETDIVNVQLGQSADVTVDALPGRIFKGHVTEVGDQALLRTTGVATSQSTTGTEEAKDFKVVVTLELPSSDLRPGLSATAKITTAQKPDALTIPIQALVSRDPAIEQVYAAHNGKADTNTVLPSHSAPVQGVYAVRANGRTLRVYFVPVATGITGTTDIEVTGGLQPGDEIVTGAFKVLRILKSGAKVQRDNTPPKLADIDATS
jgi:HlyD family secretion protein